MRVTPDVVVIGDGVIGLSTALQLAREGARCVLIGARHQGAASSAAAGLLAPNIGNLAPDVRALFRASLALYPEYLAPLQSVDPGLQLLSGLVEVLEAHTPADARHQRLEQQSLDVLQPGVFAPFGALLHESDSAVDNVRLVGALRRAVDGEKLVEWAGDRAVRIAPHSASAAVVTASGLTFEAARVVVAAGAWTPLIDGLPYRLPVRPLKGQMLSLRASILTRPVMAGHVYLVPRGDETVVGATSEEAGFDLTVHDDTIETLRKGATRLVPGLLSAPIARTWAGIRPATPDLLPIIDQDEEYASIVYAVGHSRNGILLAPLTALAVADLVQGRPPRLDLSPFSISRFGAAA